MPVPPPPLRVPLTDSETGLVRDEIWRRFFLSLRPTTTGAGASVTQLTSKSTGVTLNGATGAITMQAASLASATTVGFTLTNSAIAAPDVVIVAVKSGGTANSYTVTVAAVAAGSCVIELRNTSGGALAEAVVVNFAVVKSVMG